CGTAAGGQTFTLHNAGSVPAHITKADVTGGYSTDALNAAIPANGDLVVHVSAPNIPATSVIPKDYTGTLTLRTDAVNDSADHVVNFKESARGAILSWNVPATFGAFGSVTIQGPQSPLPPSEPFTLVNSGNADSAITLTTGAPFSVDAANFVI